MTGAPLATRERSDLAGLHWERIEPGRRGTVPHCHSAEEEVFVILGGTATLELWPSPRDESDAIEEIPIRAGHVVARPPGTRVSHSFRAGPEGVTMLSSPIPDRPHDLHAVNFLLEMTEDAIELRAHLKGLGMNAARE